MNALMLGNSLVSSGPSFRKIQISQMSLGGDSIAYGLAVGLTGTATGAFASWVRMLSGSLFDFVPSSTALAHGAGGITSTQFVSGWPSSGYLKEQIDAGGPVASFRMGTNDSPNAISVAQTVANLQTCAAAAEAAGIIPVIYAITPIPLSASGNGAGALSAEIVARNDALAVMCAEDGYYFINETDAVSTAPGNGIMAEQYAFASGNLHFGGLGARTQGAADLAALRRYFVFTGTPLANTSFITPVADFSTGTTRPTNYQAFYGGDSAITESMFTDTTGKWWRIVLGAKVGTNWLIWNQQANTGGSPANKSVDGLCRFRVTAGSFKRVVLRVANAGRSSTLGGDLMNADASQVFSASSEIYTLRSPRFTVGGSETRAEIVLDLEPNESNSTIEILQGFGVREYA